MHRSLVLLGTVLILAGCSTSTPLCPCDTATLFDATIAQTNTPALTLMYGQRNPEVVVVTYTVAIQNRSDAPMRVRQISLDSPHIVGSSLDAAHQCYDLPRLGGEVQAVVLGFDAVIDPHAWRSFEIRARDTVTERSSVLAETAHVVTIGVRYDGANGAKSERLTRKVHFTARRDGAAS